MLATLVDAPFHTPGWVYEEKYDGIRVLAYKEGDRVSLRSRNDVERATSNPEIAAAVAALPARSVLLDGEVVSFDEHLVSRFELLQQGEAPRVYAAFDCLWLDGRDLRAEPLAVRRAALERVVEKSERIFPSRRFGRNGLAAFRRARQRGLEGIVAKDGGPYVEGRTTHWCKVKTRQESAFVIGGRTQPGGTRTHLGALLLGAYAGRTLRFVGKVGSGFSHRTLKALDAALGPLVRATPPFADPPRERGTTWLEPRLVAQVAFHEWTSDDKLRQPVFLGLRDDKRPEECVLPTRR
jgi:DNA ligase D-like protein (predicted ligase)